MNSYFKSIKENPIGNRVYVSCVYEWKDNLKQLAPFKWDNMLKLWYIKVDNFTIDIFNKTRVERKFENQNPNNKKKYYYVRYIDEVEFSEKCKELEIDENEYINNILNEKEKITFPTYAPPQFRKKT